MNKLWVRLGISFSLIIILTTGVTLALVTSQRGISSIRSVVITSLREPGGLVDRLVAYYRTNRSWEGVEQFLLQGNPDTARPSLLQLTFADEDGTVLYTGSSTGFQRTLADSEQVTSLQVVVDGQVRGYLLLDVVAAPINSVLQSRLFQDFIESVVLVLIVGSAFGIVSGVIVSRWLTAPLNQVAHAARSIRDGKVAHPLPRRGSAELRTVATAFNEMSAAMQRSEALRRSLVADVAHELRTPLSVLQSNLYAILDDVRPLDRAQIARLYDETRVLSRLVNDLHEIALAEAGQLSLNRAPTDLHSIVADITATFEVIAEEKALTIENRAAPDLPPLLLDSERMRQVLYNLVHNAVRHTPSGGTITITAATEGDQVCLSVADSGQGIAPEHLPHVFDRFYRADTARNRSTGGTGLGLAIARGIVEAHGGHLHAESPAANGQGTRFVVRLPYTAAPLATPRRESPRG